VSLTGVWMNELNSVMVLTEHEDKSLTGKYRSRVGRDPSVRDVCGRTSAPDNGQQMAAFSACFEIGAPKPGEGHYSVCAWSGWSQSNDDGKQVLITHWLLSVGASDRNDRWGSTKVGSSIFQKVSDSPDESRLSDNAPLR
jgi:hypothetical protein